MFDVGLTELMVIAIVALVVIGPERLPKVARTAGHILGRLQRYVSDVKSDINREMQLDELKKLQQQVSSEVSSLETSVTHEMREIESSVNTAVAPIASDVNAAAAAASPQSDPASTAAGAAGAADTMPASAAPATTEVQKS
jgi:sec-independent protein translocase protein TatB